jgi:hypothetical protein
LIPGAIARFRQRSGQALFFWPATQPVAYRAPDRERAGMQCLACGSAGVAERPEPTAQGYRRFRCRVRGKRFNECSGGRLNQTQYPSDVIVLVVLWRLRYNLSLRDLSKMFLIRGIVFKGHGVWRYV